MGVDLVSPASGGELQWDLTGAVKGEIILCIFYSIFLTTEDDPLVQKTESSSKSNPESEPRTKEGNKQPDPEPMVSGNEEEVCLPE